MTDHEPDPVDELFDIASRDACVDDVCEFWPDVYILTEELYGHELGLSSIKDLVDMALQGMQQHPAVTGMSAAEVDRIRLALEALRSALAQYRDATEPFSKRLGAMIDERNPHLRKEKP